MKPVETILSDKFEVDERWGCPMFGFLRDCPELCNPVIAMFMIFSNTPYHLNVAVIAGLNGES